MNKLFTFIIALLFLAVSSSCSKNEYDLFSNLYGVVTDTETGEPVSNANVQLSPGGLTKITGSDGFFEFSDLTPQQYTITVQKEGYNTNRKNIIAVAGEHSEVNIPITKK